jgi:sigma-E factor negative regulatory protein RseA
MTDEIREQISVFIDDELSAEECEFFVRRLQRDPDSRSHYVRYQLIGAALREEIGGSLRAGDLRRRVQFALNGVAAAAPRESEPEQPTLSPYVKPALGFGIAASVAIVALVGLRLSSGVPIADVAATTADSTLELLSKPSYVVPMQVPEAPFATPPIQLTKYLIQHSGYASPLNRTTVHLNVVSGSTEFADDARTGRTEAGSVRGAEEPQE